MKNIKLIIFFIAILMVSCKESIVDESLPPIEDSEFWEFTKDINLQVNDMQADSKGRIYILSNGWLYYFNDDSCSVLEHTYYTNVKSFAIDPMDNLYILSKNENTYYWDRETEESIRSEYFDVGDLDIHDLGMESIGVSPSGSAFIAARNGIFKSTDYGVNWILVYKNSNANFKKVFVDQSETIFVSNNFIEQTLLCSKNDGGEWEITKFPNDLPNVLFSSDELLIGSFGSVYRSTNEGIDWVELESFSGMVEGIEIEATGEIYATIYGKGVSVSTDGGKTWEYKNKGLKSLDLRASSKNSNGFLFVSTLNGEIYRRLLQ